jgi:acetyltransferase-like isoleucine patch superfamily enzyme
MNENLSWLLLPDALRKPSRWSICLRRRAARRGVDLSRATLGAGRPWPQVRNEAGTITLGEVFLAAGVRLWAHKGGELTIGDGTVLDAGVEAIAWTRLTIGRNCYLGWDVLVMDTDLHGVTGRPAVNKPVSIGNEVRIGARSMILKGVTIGDGALIHPGSIVTRDVPPGAEIGPPPAVVKGRVRQE